MQKLNRNGQLLIEAMVAISIIVVGLFGILELLSTSLGLNKVVADQYKAAYLASEGIEVIRSIVDENISRNNPWNQTVADSCDSGCRVVYNSSAILSGTGEELKFKDGIYDYDSAGTDTSFARVITVEMVTGCQMKVTSHVDWTTRGGGEFEINLEDHFYNWRGSSC